MNLDTRLIIATGEAHAATDYIQATKVRRAPPPQQLGLSWIH